MSVCGVTATLCTASYVTCRHVAETHCKSQVWAFCPHWISLKFQNDTVFGVTVGSDWLAATQKERNRTMFYFTAQTAMQVREAEVFNAMLGTSVFHFGFEMGVHDSRCLRMQSAVHLNYKCLHVGLFFLLFQARAQWRQTELIYSEFKFICLCSILYFSLVCNYYCAM